LSDEIRNRVNTELAHLSYSRTLRISSEDKKWELADFLPLILRCANFVSSRTQEDLHQLLEYRSRNAMVPISWSQLEQDLTDLEARLQSA
jgi:hypothetical protein